VDFDPVIINAARHVRLHRLSQRDALRTVTRPLLHPYLSCGRHDILRHFDSGSSRLSAVHIIIT
jgi:hypothetical protein